MIDAAIRYFAGERPEFFAVAVNSGEQPPFFARVYDHIRTLGADHEQARAGRAGDGR